MAATFHFSVQLWAAIAVHKSKSSADVIERTVKIVTQLRVGLCWPHLRAKRLGSIEIDIGFDDK